MRDGNHFQDMTMTWTMQVLAYLWGMETITKQAEQEVAARVLAYLWGMET